MKMVQSCQRSRAIKFECDQKFNFLKALTGNVQKPHPEWNDRNTTGKTL